MGNAIRDDASYGMISLIDQRWCIIWQYHTRNKCE